MNKNMMIGLVVAVVLFGGGFFFLNSQGGDSGDSVVEEETMEKEDSVDDDDAMMEDDDKMMEKDGDAMMEGEDKDEMMMEDGEVVEFDVEGTSFEFDVTEITVKKGTKVTINFTSGGGFHDWVVDEFDANTEQVQTGDSSSVEFVADEEGTFEYYCSVGNHRAQGMVGTLTVTE